MWTVLSFFLMLLIVWKILLPSLVKVLDERKNRVLSDLEAARKNREESAKILEEQKQLLAKARSQAEEILRQAEEMGRVLREEKQKEAMLEVEARLKKAEAQIQADVERVKNDLRKETVSLVVRGIESVLEESLNETQKMVFINRAIRAVESGAARSEPKKAG
uniref:ATP synthase subunit b n=1 Tax=Leptospirillum ferriphilum TaxID=178606 RepID=K4EQ81_9BACT|nr:ATP synthase F0 B subunit [Leptospirillum ferriphilum]